MRRKIWIRNLYWWWCIHRLASYKTIPQRNEIWFFQHTLPQRFNIAYNLYSLMLWYQLILQLDINLYCIWYWIWPAWFYFWCYILGNPIQNARAPYNGKYWLWHELWPSQFKPPSYCNGQCALLTSEAASKIYNAAKITNRNNFRLEDFFYVGILRLKAGISSPNPVIFKNSTWPPGLRAACFHMADTAKYETLTDTLDRYLNGTLNIFAGAWLIY